MPTIACGDDDPLPVHGGPPNTITKPLPTPTLERPRSGRGGKSTSSSTTNATNFEDKFKALSQRLGTPSAVSNNNSHHHEDVTSSEAMISSMTERSSNNDNRQQSALEILKGGNFSLAQILHQQNQKERNTNSEPATTSTTNATALLSDLASEFATEFKEIDNYHYNLEKERENKERQEELLQKKRYREELKKQKMLLREHKKLMDLEHGGVENHEDHDDDRRTTYSTTVASTMFQNRNQNNKPSTANTTTNSQVRTRDDLYEIPLSISSAAGPMKRRKDGAVKATTGYRKMFSNNNNQPNNNSSGYQNGVAPLMEKISSVSLSTTRVRSPQPSFVSSSRASDYYMMENNNNNNNDDDGRQSTTNMTSITNRKPATATTTRTSSKNQQLHRFATDNISVAASDAFSITAGKRKTKNIVPIHNKVAAASSVARSSSNTRNVASSSQLPQSHNHRKEQQNQKENDEDEEEEEDDDILLEDEGAIRFCCFKICARNRKTGEFECSVCKKSFSNAVEDDEQKEKHSMEIQAGTSHHNTEEDGDNLIQKQQQEQAKPPPSSAEGQFDRPIIPPNVKYSEDDETGEAEQQRLFQLAVLQWRNTSSTAENSNNDEEGKLSHNTFDIQRQLVEPDYELELEQKRRCPDVSEFVYFSKLWDGLMMRAEDEEDDDF